MESDNSKPHPQEMQLGNYESNPNLAASIMIKNSNNVWVDDRMAKKCYNFSVCKIEFNWYNRKHHCRNCGNVFCYQCVAQSIVIPSDIINRPEPADYWNLSHYIFDLKGIEEKVCKQCHQSIQNKVLAHNKIIQTLNNPYSINQINDLTSLDINVRDHYLDHLRNIQYYLPNHVYSQIDKRIIRNNSQHFIQHSKYLVHLIKSTDWNSVSETESEQILKLLNGKRNKSCDELYCTRTCQEILSFDDCINILYSEANNLHPKILDYIFSILRETPEEIIICHLPFFIILIKNTINETLRILLFNLLGTSLKLIYQTFWLLTTEKNDVSKLINNIGMIDPTHSIKNSNIDEYFKLFDRKILIQMMNEHRFYVDLIDNLDNPADYLLKNFDTYKPISLPYDPEVKLLGVYIDSIVIKNSNSNPVIIPFETTRGPKQILFKRESITNDLIVLNLISLCDIILKETLETDFGAITYPVMPITANAGMIEIINNAETIYSICSTNKKAIWQHIFEKNESKVVSEVMATYMHSLVSYTLHSYFIGLGDRHLENIMITDDGRIFHIDFGFILGKDSYPITSTDIKLNKDMLDVIGTKYSSYLEICSQGVIIIRKYFNMFFILLMQIKCSNISEKHIEKFIMGRFQPRQTDQVVFDELLAVIDQSNNAYTTTIRDFIHYHAQEKTIQNGLSSLFNSAVGVVKTIGSTSMIGGVSEI